MWVTVRSTPGTVKLFSKGTDERPGPAGVRRCGGGYGQSVAVNASLGWRVLGGVSAILAGLAARKLLVTTWRRTTGDNPPANPAAPGTDWRKAIVYAVVSGAAMGLARMLATRKAAEYYAKSTGHLPPGMEEVT